MKLAANMSRKKVRLRTGLAMQLLVLIGVGLLLLSSFVVRQTRNDLVGQVDNSLKGALSGRVRDNQGLTGQGVAGQSSAGPTSSPRPGKAQGKPQDKPPRANVASPGSATPNLELPPSATVMFDKNDREIFASGSGSNGVADPFPKLDAAFLRQNAGRVLTIPGETGSLRFRAVSELLNDGVLLVEAAPLRLVDSAVADLIRTLTVGSLVVMALAAVALYLLLRRALQPLGQIAQAAGVVAAGNTGHGVAVNTPYRELDQLSGSLDAMVAKLGTALDGQREALNVQQVATNRLRSFVSDASHELQTPVTSMRGWAELYRRGGLNPEAVSGAMLRIENEASRMGRLIDDLLVLARADEQRTPTRIPVDLASVCADAVEAARAIAPDRSIAFTVASEPVVADSSDTGPEQRLDPSTKIQQAPTDFPANATTDPVRAPILVQGDPDQLRQVLDNLLANVRTHTPGHAKTFVHIAKVESAVEVTVSDDGPGFDPDQLDHAFDRFWRADTTNRKSHGLGLAIVEAIVRAHGGSVSARNGSKPNGSSRPGATISIQMPSLPSPEPIAY